MRLTADQDRLARLGLPAMILAVLLQSTGPVIIKDSEAGSLTFAIHRLWVAAVLTIVLQMALGGRLSWRAIRLSLPGGIVFAMNLAIFYTAIKHTSVANASVISATQPLAVLFVVNRFFGEAPRRSDFGWAVVAIAGVGMVVYGANRADTGNIEGDLLAIGAMLFFAAYLTTSKRARQSVDLLSYQAAYTLVATVVMVPIVAASGQGFAMSDSRDWWLVLLMAVLPGGGHILINFAHSYVRLVVVSLLILCVPIGSTMMAWMWLDESLAVMQVAGIAVVIVSLGFVVTRGPTRAAAQSGEIATADDAGL